MSGEVHVRNCEQLGGRFPGLTRLVVTASDKNILENQVRPVIETFLSTRGLRLSSEKTVISNVHDGLDFLGKNIRKYKDKLLIKPSRKNVQTFLNKIQAVIKTYRTVKTISLLNKLNPMIRGWAMYHRMDHAKSTFRYIDYRIWCMIWKWANRRHRNKNKAWIKNRYFKRHQGADWILFDHDEQGDLVVLCRANKIAIKRHAAIKGNANPYDPDDEQYFEQRSDRIMRDKLEGRRTLKYLYNIQKGVCEQCQQRITKQTRWNVHHVAPKYLGGKDTINNLVLLHPVCHQQLHHRSVTHRRVDQGV